MGRKKYKQELKGGYGVHVCIYTVYIYMYVPVHA